jgi:ubiquinone/menaquinone biosynthesis C-methylase UbiE
MKQSKRALDNFELTKMWDRYQSSYSKYISKNFLPVYLNMFNLLKIENCKNPVILDMGCGTGDGIKLIRVLLNKNHIIYGNDLSTNMLNYSFSNLRGANNCYITELYLRNDKILNSHIDLQNDLEEINKHHDQSFNKTIVKLFEMNNEELKFREETFDYIISNFSLNIVNDYHKMINESYRVIKKNGQACFSIWGRPENSFPFTVITNILKKHKIPLPEMRSFFHLSKEGYLKEIFSKYNQIYIGYSTINLNIFSFEEFKFMIESPVYNDIFEKIYDKELKLNIYNDIRREVENNLKYNKFLNTEIITIKVIK